MHDTRSRFNAITQWFETLTPQTLGQIASIYSPEASFLDPFNNLAGIQGITQVYQHMFDTLTAPSFVITNSVVQDQQAFVAWDFNFEIRGRTMLIQGCTHFVLNTQGLIIIHRDYWDAAEELYEKIPVLASLMRFLKRKLTVQR